MLATALVAMLALAGPAEGVAVSGAGATSMEKVVAGWSAAYEKANGLKVGYEAVGSGEGIKRVAAEKATFALSDVALSPAELEAAFLAQFPLALDGIVPVVNLPGVKTGTLRLTGPVLADILRGAVTSWDAPAIAKLNPGMTLPATAIKVVHRSDKSGSTAVLTDYLARVSPPWSSSLGNGFTVAWTVGEPVAGGGAMADAVARSAGAIGYLDYAKASERKLATVVLQNRDGQWVAPSPAGFRSAAAAFPWESARGFSAALVNQAGAESWPITSAPFAMMKISGGDARARETALRFFNWALTEGAPTTESAGLVPLPPTLVKTVQAAWGRIFKNGEGKALFTAPK